MTAPASDIPARLDRLPWSRWHWRIVLALGIAWTLDGLEVTLVGSLGAVLERSDTLGLSAVQIGWSGSLYIAGAVVGALLFGRLTDRFGRKKLFLITLAVYMLATFATAFSWNFAFFALCRFVTGIGIGGEYAAINAAIDELIPARMRGRVSLAINGTFWIGAALGAGLSLVLLDPAVLGPEWGWRACFAAGALLSAAIWLVRRHVPESPRWLLAHGRADEAERILQGIERECAAQHGTLPRAHGGIVFMRQGVASFSQVLHILLRRYRRRSVVAMAMMIAQAFFYNAIFFTYALVLTRYYGVPDVRVALYIFPFALGNVLGPLLLGPLFDVVGRRRMIGLTYVLSGVGLVLTVSEVFPLEMRGLAIAIFYAIGTGAGGFVAPALFGVLIETGSRGAVAIGYGIGASLMVIAGVLAWRFGVDAERRPLEAVATPLGVDDTGRP